MLNLAQMYDLPDRDSLIYGAAVIAVNDWSIFRKESALVDLVGAVH
ncbi:hypothetical protein [Nostoc sp.]